MAIPLPQLPYKPNPSNPNLRVCKATFRYLKPEKLFHDRERGAPSPGYKHQGCIIAFRVRLGYRVLGLRFRGIGSLDFGSIGVRVSRIRI